MGAAQTLAWASKYHLSAILAVPVARALSLFMPTVLTALGAAPIVSAFTRPR